MSVSRGWGTDEAPSSANEVEKGLLGAGETQRLGPLLLGGHEVSAMLLQEEYRALSTEPCEQCRSGQLSTVERAMESQP